MGVHDQRSWNSGHIRYPGLEYLGGPTTTDPEIQGILGTKALSTYGGSTNRDPEILGILGT